MKHINNRRNGQVLIIGIIFMAVILIFSTTIFSKVSSYISFGSKSVEKQGAVHVAEAGIDYALKQISLNPNYPGTSGSLVDIGTPGPTTGQVEITISNSANPPNSKMISVESYVPRKINFKVKQSATIKIIPDAQSITFDYAANVGDGGLTMNVDSEIIGDASSLKTGSDSITGDVSSSKIEGDAKSAGLINPFYPEVTGTKYENQSLPPLPTFDYSYWQDKADDGGTTTCSPCELSGHNEIGPRKFEGDVKILASADVTINGPIWITGDLDMYDEGYINLSNSFTNSSTVIIVEGDTDATTGYIHASTPTNRLFFVSKAPTVNTAIELGHENNNAIFYALNGGITIYNNATEIPFVVTKKLILQGAKINFDSSIQTTYLSTSPIVSSWKIDKSTYHFK